MTRRVITAGMIAGVAVAALGYGGARAAGSQQPGSTTASCTVRALKPITVGNQPGPIVITPDGKTAYVANVGSGTVTPIRIATNTALKSIKVGSTPNAMVITPDGAMVYVADYQAQGKVVPIRTVTNTALKPIKVGVFPQAITITRTGGPCTSSTPARSPPKER
jgi:YVTN family beta-propeller protein